MRLEGLKASLNRTRQAVRELDLTLPGRPQDRLKAYRDDPARIVADAGFDADPWQLDLLRATDPRILICAARQIGKSQGTAFLAESTALNNPGSTTLIVAPVAEQSNELLRKVIEVHHALGDPVAVKRESATKFELANGSRVIALPGTERRMRSYTAKLVLLDEAARIPDAVMHAIGPTMAVSRGRLVALSSAFAKTGFFYQCWTEGEGFRRFSIKATDCPRVPREFLEQQRRLMGPRWFAMEFLNEWADAVGGLFAGDDIRAMRAPDIAPLFGAGGYGPAAESTRDPTVKPLFA